MKEKKISRRKFVYGATCSICSALILPSCAEVPITNRKQLNFYEYNLPIILPSGGLGGLPQIYSNEKHLNNVIEIQYQDFIKKAKSKKILVDNTAESKKIREIGMHMSNSINKYHAKNSLKNPVSDFRWEFALLDVKDNKGNLIKNAWCMPGGKIAVYSGMLKITKNTNGLAAVMGHDIAHAVAKLSV